MYVYTGASLIARTCRHECVHSSVCTFVLCAHALQNSRSRCICILLFVDHADPRTRKLLSLYGTYCIRGNLPCVFTPSLRKGLLRGLSLPCSSWNYSHYPDDGACEPWCNLVRKKKRTKKKKNQKENEKDKQKQKEEEKWRRFAEQAFQQVEMGTCHHMGTTSSKTRDMVPSKDQFYTRSPNTMDSAC